MKNANSLLNVTHKNVEYNWEVDSNQPPHRTVLLRDGKFKHLLICAEEFVGVILDRVEVVVKA